MKCGWGAVPETVKWEGLLTLGAPPCGVPSTAHSTPPPQPPGPAYLPSLRFEGGFSRSARLGGRGHRRAGPSRIESTLRHARPVGLRVTGRGVSAAPRRRHRARRMSVARGIRADPGLRFSATNAQECDCRVFMTYSSLFFLI